ncbi:heliorhodopsin HeR [Candidatus Saccharibacteria bacterium]|nr:heliorhodopsin HeR [Candidatus Saccharibacteria bacterium]
MLHAAQGIAVVVLSKSDSLFPVTTNYLTVDTIRDTDAAPVLVSATRHLFDVNLAYVVAAFFFMSALAHLYIATVYRKKYEANLEKGINKARWFEYALSASTMMIAISYLVGVSDFSTLLLIFGATAVMNLLGLVMEVHNQSTTKTNWLSYKIGSLVGILPWLVIGMYLFDASYFGEGQIPTFVYYIYGSIFVFFMSFAVNMWLQYRGKGRWSNYLYGEKAYMVLSLVAKSALAWQVFAGTLRP